MTLVLALRFTDGVVLASDGQVTSDAAGQPTRAPVRKLFDIGGRIAWGAAGSTGLLQTLRAEVDALNGSARDPAQLRTRLAGTVIPLQQRALREFVPHAGAEPAELACIFCWCDASGPRILSIPRTGGDHQFHGHHAAIGSGDIFAESTVRSIAPANGAELTLEQAKMVAFRAIADAIDVAAVFLGPPIQLYVVTRAGAERVSHEEISSTLAASVAHWKRRERRALDERER